MQLLGAMLREFGVEKGDRVIIYMPMVPEAIFAMLACARIGAIHSVVFGGFAAKELATRIDDAKPKVILSASCGMEGARVVPYKPLLDEAINLAKHKPPACMILQRPQCEAQLTPGRDHDWRTVWENAVNYAKTSECVPVAATDPLYILYTSGTTGIPKGVVRDNGGHLVALKWSMSNLYGIKPGEVWWSGSDIGWVVGHSYIVYAPLFHGCTSILYEGKPVGTPDAGAFWRLIAQHGVVSLFTAPTAFRAIKKEDPKGELIKKYDLSKFRTLFLAGERADPPTIQWAEEVLKGQSPDEELYRRAGEAAAEECDPPDDARGTPEYKRDLVRVLLVRAVEQADALGPRAGRNRQPVDKSERRGKKTGDDAGRNHPERDLGPVAVAHADREQIEYHRHGQQAERKHDQHLMNWMPEQLGVTLHIASCGNGCNMGTHAVVGSGFSRTADYCVPLAFASLRRQAK